MLKEGREVVVGFIYRIRLLKNEKKKAENKW